MSAELQHEPLLVRHANTPRHIIGYGMIRLRCRECYASSIVLVHDGRVRFCPNCGAEVRIPRHMRMPELQRFELVPIKEPIAPRHGKLHELDDGSLEWEESDEEIARRVSEWEHKH